MFLKVIQKSQSKTRSRLDAVIGITKSIENISKKINSNTISTKRVIEKGRFLQSLIPILESKINSLIDASKGVNSSSSSSDSGSSSYIDQLVAKLDALTKIESSNKDTVKKISTDTLASAKALKEGIFCNLL